MDADTRNSPERENDPNLTDLLRVLERATGADKELDATLATCLGLEGDDYTGDAVLCRELVARMLPYGRLQVGYDVCGVLPSAALQEEGKNFNAIAPTVPLVILRVFVEALLERQS